MSVYYPPPEPRNKDEFDPLHIYTENMTSTQNGHAMWYAFTRESTMPGEFDIQVGDVGYWYKGDFFRFFNVFCAEGHPFNFKGVPEGFKPLPLDEDQDLQKFPAYFKEGHIVCGGQMKKLDQHPHPQGQPNTTVYNFRASGTGAALIVFNDAHKVLVHHSRLPALQKYLNKNVEAWAAYMVKASGFVIPEREISLIYGYTKTERSLHIAVRPDPKSPKPTSRALVSITVDRTRGIFATIELPPGWDGECLGGPHLDHITELLSRYVYVNYMMKNGAVGQLLRAAKGIFIPSRNNSWDLGSKENDHDEDEPLPQSVASPSRA